MKRLLAYEFRKLTRAKSFYVCSIIMFVMAFLSLLVTRLVADTFSASFGEVFDELGVQLTASYALISAISNTSFTLLVGIFVALYACSDFDMRTVKVIYARGFSKGQVYFAKYIFTMIAVSVMFSFALLTSFLSGVILYPSVGEFSDNFLLLLLGQWLTALAYGSFAFSLCLNIRRTGVSIAFAILGTSIVSLALSVIDAIMNIEFKLNEYWIDNFFVELTNVNTSVERIVIYLAVSVAYTAIFTIVGYFLNKQKEI